jgi:DNA-binding IscR family transcriptional regulator
MPLLPRKGVLAVVAVIDVAMQEHGQPISAKTLAARHRLPPRHLEPVLQALVRCGILKGIPGLHGGYDFQASISRIWRATRRL